MRLILSSCDFSNPSSRRCITEHLPVKLARCRVLFIPNEKATSEKIQSGKYHARLQSYGFMPEYFYIFDHFFKRSAYDKEQPSKIQCH